MSILTHKKIVVTRASNQNAELVQKLEKKGAVPVIYPCIEINFLSFKIPEKKYDWVVFTSQNAEKALEEYTLPQKLERGKKFSSKAVIQFFENQLPQKILLPQGNLAGNLLKESLERQGHEVTKLIVYETRPVTHSTYLNLDSIDAVTFTSPSTAKNFPQRPHSKTVIACIGTTTYLATQDLGFKNIIHAKEHSVDSLLQALEEYFTCIISPPIPSIAQDDLDERRPCVN